MNARRFVALAAFAFAAMLGWGWWHASTHASLNIQLEDRGLATDHAAFATPEDARLELFDASGSLLATARVVQPYGYVSAMHPELGDCSTSPPSGADDTDRTYASCFAEWSRWAATWAPRARTATVVTGRCTIRDVPVRQERSRSGWWCWWVPLPHVGGRPYGYYSVQVRIDTRTCTSVE
jgi:hypothetical protein